MPDVEKRTDSQATMAKVLVGPARRDNGCRRRGICLCERAPVGVDARLDLRGHHRRDLDHQHDVSAAVESRFDPAAQARL